MKDDTDRLISLRAEVAYLLDLCYVRREGELEGVSKSTAKVDGEINVNEMRLRARAAVWGEVIQFIEDFINASYHMPIGTLKRVPPEKIMK